MFLTLKEIVKWLGVTVFELWLNILAVLVFSLLVTLKLEGVLTSTWWNIFIPLFACDGLNTYFCVIVFIRMYQEREYRAGALRLLSSLVCLTCLFVCQLLFCQKLEGQNTLSYSEVFASVFIALQVLLVRACQVH